jgi:transcription initiation factor TFIIIB Brf1 subunit/transcription initiation factor TFIIB
MWIDMTVAMESMSPSFNRFVGTPPDDGVENACCEAPRVIDINGELICMNCGIVHEVTIVPEVRRSYTPDERVARVHSEAMTPVYRGTIMTMKGMKRTNPGSEVKMRRLIKFNNTYCKNDQRSLGIYNAKLRKAATSRGIPYPVEATAWSMIAFIVKNKVSRGRPINTTIHAALFHACRVHGMPVFRFEFYTESFTPREFTNAHKFVVQLFAGKYMARKISFDQYLNRAGNIAGMPHGMIVKARKLLGMAVASGYMPWTKNPLTVLAGLFYVVCHENGIYIDGYRATQGAMAERFHVTEISLRVRAKEIIRACHVTAKH